MASSFHRVGKAGMFLEGGMTGMIVAGWPVLLVRSDGQLHAMIDRCSHAASLLSTGRVRRSALMCPLHGARFEVSTGRCIGGMYNSLLVFETREDIDGWVEVAVPDEAPQAEYQPIRARS